MNLKGGVGKTTIAANLAVAMGKHGWRVLVVDLDYQSSLSQLLLSPAEMDELVVSRRLDAQVVRGRCPWSREFSNRRSCASASSEDSEICLVAADEELGDVETAVVASLAGDGSPVTTCAIGFRRILHSPEISERFDFIVLDCPPRLTTASINALAASDYATDSGAAERHLDRGGPSPLALVEAPAPAACPDLSVIGVVGNKSKILRRCPGEETAGGARFPGAALPGAMGRAGEVLSAAARCTTRIRIRCPLLIPPWAAPISTWLTSSTRNCHTMRVADLQSFLRRSLPPLAASGAKKEILDDLERACEGLKPFAEHPIKDFAGFLVRAEEYCAHRHRSRSSKAGSCPSGRETESARDHPRRCEHPGRITL